MDIVAARPRRITDSDLWFAADQNPSVRLGPRGTLAPVAAPGLAPTPRPPGRALLRVAGVLTQLSCGACLLIGTIALVLVEQNRTGGLAQVAGWLVAAMAGLVFGGLIYRGGLVSLLLAAALDAGFGVVLAMFDHDALARLLTILGPSDVAAIHRALVVIGCAMIGAAVVCLLAVPQGVRYARWFRDAAATRSAMSTARGFPPPPVPVRTATYIIPAEDQPASRRRIYAVLGGAAIGVGAGIGVLVSSTPGGPPAGDPRPPAVAAASSPPRPAASKEPPRPAVSSEPPRAVDAGVAIDARAAVDAGAAIAATAPADAAAVTVAAEPALPPIKTVQELVLVLHRAIARVDRKALAGVIAAGAFGFGTEAGEAAEGRDAVIAQLVHDLGDPPPGGFTVESRAISIGEDRGHAWIAEQLDVTGGDESRSFAISELAAVIDGHWQLVALHWATPVDDATAERLAILGRLPQPARIDDRHDGPAEVDQAVRSAFASRVAFAEARSERGDAFNYGSGGERAHGGVTIRRIFSRLRADIRIHDGARVVAAGAWDRTQTSDPRIAWAALNVDYTAKTRAATEVTQTFRVLAVLIKEAKTWRVVQTQWSNGGPIR